MTRSFFRLVSPAIVGILIACSGAGDSDLFGQFGDGGQSNLDSTPGEDTGIDLDTGANDTGNGGKKDGGGKDVHVADTNGGIDASDAGKSCNATVNGVNALSSVCNPGYSFFLQGGKFTSGHYSLEEINVLGDKATCSGFVQGFYRGALDLVDDGTGDVATMDFVLSSNLGTDRRTMTLVAPGVTSTMDVTQTCPVVLPPTQWGFDTFGMGGKRFRFQAPFGPYQAIYVFARP